MKIPVKISLPILCFVLIGASVAVAQRRPVQTIKGLVLDKTTKQSLVGATVILPETNPLKGATTDALGLFKDRKSVV